jgi:cytochrome c oxidase assembly protein subunit 11
MPRRDPDPGLARRNRRTAIAAGLVVAGMAGLSFAAVPLYSLFCQVTGYGGTPQINSAAAPGATAQTITVRFDANTQQNLPWRFRPDQPSVTLPLGDQQVAFYRAENRSSAPVTGIATYNVTPEVVGPYFHKTACFCFNEQTLEPGQGVDMPVAFWVDPKIKDDPNTRDIRTITLSYTFFRSLNDAAIASAGPHVGPLKP